MATESEEGDLVLFSPYATDDGWRLQIDDAPDGSWIATRSWKPLVVRAVEELKPEERQELHALLRERCLDVDSERPTLGEIYALTDGVLRRLLQLLDHERDAMHARQGVQTRIALSPNEAADAVGVSEDTVRRAIRERQLAYCQPGGPRSTIFILRDDLIEWLKSGRREADPTWDEIHASRDED